MELVRLCMALAVLAAATTLQGCGGGGTTTPAPTAPQVTVLLRSPEEYFYSAEVQIGGGQTFEVMVDTGSPVFAVAASAGLKGPYFNGVCDGADVSFKYGGGSSFVGRACENVDVQIGGVSVGKPLFVGMNETDSGGRGNRYGGFNLSGAQMQGILGLSYQSQAQYQDQKVFEAFELLELGCTSCSSSAICQAICAHHGGCLNSDLFKPMEDSVFNSTGSQQVFSMQCCGPTRNSVSGKLVFGAVDHSLHSGEIKYTPIIFEGFYFVSVTSVGTDATNMVPYATPPLLPSSFPVPPGPLSIGALNYFRYQRTSFYVDSGNPYLGLGSGETFTAVQDSINKVAATLGLGAVILPLHSANSPACVKPTHLKHFPDIILQLQDGVTLQIPPAKYFKSQKKHPDCLWPFVIGGMNVLGLPLLETYFTVYDRAQKRIGFAPVAGCNEEVTSREVLSI